MRLWDKLNPSRLGHLRRLSRPVDGWLSPAEEAVLFRLARVVPREQCIVELGSWLGRSAIMLGGGSQSGNRVGVYCVDHFQAQGLAKPVLEQRAPDLAGDYLGQFQANVNGAGLEQIIHAVRNGSAEAGENWTGPPVGLIFIDADHSYAAVRGDWQNWHRHMATQGITAFHDYSNPDYDVTRFVDELIADGRLRSVERHDSILCGEVVHAPAG